MPDPITPLTPEELANQEAGIPKEGYVRRGLVALDIFANVITGGNEDETLSSRAARADLQGKWWGRTMSRFLDVFQKDHGADAIAGDYERAETVEELEEKADGITDK